MRASIQRFLAITFALLLGCAIQAQAQTSVALSLLGSIPSSTSNSNVYQNPSKQAGFMVELRHISNPLVGYDVSYSFSRANQGYTSAVPYCPVSHSVCTTLSQAVHANAQALTLNWVVSFPLSDFRAFALAGGGFQRFNPTGIQTGATRSQTKAAFDYGAGLDWTVLPHLGLRFQYRGYLYKAPALATAFTSTDKYTQNAEPMIGAYFNF